MAYYSTIRRKMLSRKTFHHHTDLSLSIWLHKELVLVCTAMSSATWVLTDFVISFHRLLLSHQQFLEQTHPQATPDSILVLPLDYVEADFNLMRSWHSMTWFWFRWWSKLLVLPSEHLQYIVVCSMWGFLKLLPSLSKFVHYLLQFLKLFFLILTPWFLLKSQLSLPLGSAAVKQLQSALYHTLTVSIGVRVHGKIHIIWRINTSI